MSVSSNIVSAPIGLKEVADLLGETTYDVGYLCSRSFIINPCAKWKPFRYNSVATMAHVTDFSTDGVTPLSPRALCQFGTNVPDLVVASAGTPNNGATWSCNTPRGSAQSEPYRLTDFDGYQHERSKLWAVGWFNTNPDGTPGNVDWSHDNWTYVYLTLYDGETHRKPNSLLLSDVIQRSGYFRADQMYIWVAIIYGNSVFAKRSQYSIYEMCSNTAKQQDIIQFLIRSGRYAAKDGVIQYQTADFDGHLQLISGDYRVLAFAGTATQYDYCTNVANISYKKSLACISGCDYKNLNFTVAAWQTSLSVAVVTAPTRSYNQSTYPRTVTFGNLVFKISRGSVTGTLSQASFVYRVTALFAAGGYLNGHSEHETVVLATGSLNLAANQNSGNITVQIPTAYQTAAGALYIYIETAKDSGSAYGSPQANTVVECG